MSLSTASLPSDFASLQAFAIALQTDYKILETSLQPEIAACDAELYTKSSLADAILYYLTSWNALTRYTTYGRLDICNNAAERVILITRIATHPAKRIDQLLPWKVKL